MENKPTLEPLTDAESRIIRRLRGLLRFGFGEMVVTVQDHKIMQIDAKEKERVS